MPDPCFDKCFEVSWTPDHVSLTCSCSEEVLTSWPALQLYCSRRLSLCTIRVTSSSIWLKNLFSCATVFPGLGSWQNGGERGREREWSLIRNICLLIQLLTTSVLYISTVTSIPFTLCIYVLLCLPTLKTHLSLRPLTRRICNRKAQLARLSQSCVHKQNSLSPMFPSCWKSFRDTVMRLSFPCWFFFFSFFPPPLALGDAVSALTASCTQ